MDKAGQMLQCNICPGVFLECSIFLALYVRKCPALSAQKMQLDKPAKGDVVPWLSGCPAGWLAVGPCCRAGEKAECQAWPGKAGIALAPPSPRQGPTLAYAAGLAVIPPPRAPCPPAGRYGPALPRRLAAHCPACRGPSSPCGCACLDPAPGLSRHVIDPSMLLPDPRITSITGNRAALR